MSIEAAFSIGNFFDRRFRSKCHESCAQHFFYVNTRDLTQHINLLDKQAGAFFREIWTTVQRSCTMLHISRVCA